MKANKLMGVVLAGMLVAGLSGCTGSQEELETLKAQYEALKAEKEELENFYGAKKVPEINTSYDYVDVSELEGNEKTEGEIYNKVFGQFAHRYEESYNASSTSEKYALQAIAEAKLLETGAILPGDANGGTYGMSKVAYKSAPTVGWGTDQYRVGSSLVCNQTIKVEDRNALKALYVEKKGTGTYLTEAKAYLQEKGYTFNNSYTYAYSGDPKSWDVLDDYYAVTAEPIVLTYDGLVQYNCEDTIVPALATDTGTWGTDGESLTIEFTIRDGVKWTKYDGSELAAVTADDFVAGFQHMLDAGKHSWYVDGVIKGASDYDGDISKVGIKAEGQKLTYTFEPKLTSIKDYFLTMLEYSPFAPMCRSYYTSLGGTFGTSYKTEGKGNYGKDYTSIAYCGAYRITTYTAKSTFVFQKNPNYYNSELVNCDTITWLFNDGTDSQKNYNDFVAGTVASTSLNSSTMALAKEAGLFEDYAYVSGVDCSSYPFWFNGNRQTFVNFDDTYKLDSQKTESQKSGGQKALANHYFRLALCCSIDRVAYEAASIGDSDIAANCLLNSYTPATFVHLTEDVTVDINGVATKFEAGASYGEVMQAQITADGFPFVVWKADSTAEDGRGTGSGYDGWYNVEWARSFLREAVKELAAEGLEVSASNPIVLELPYISTSETSLAANATVKSSIEAATNGLVQINLLSAPTAYNLYYAAYYNETGAQNNVDISKISGWGPDYGDPKTFLDTFLPTESGMVKNFGIY